MFTSQQQDNPGSLSQFSIKLIKLQGMGRSEQKKEKWREKRCVTAITAELMADPEESQAVEKEERLPAIVLRSAATTRSDRRKLMHKHSDLILSFLI